MSCCKRRAPAAQPLTPGNDPSPAAATRAAANQNRAIRTPVPSPERPASIADAPPPAADAPGDSPPPSSRGGVVEKEEEHELMILLTVITTVLFKLFP